MRPVHRIQTPDKPPVKQERTPNPAEKVLGISHCNCPARAQAVKEAILERIPVKDVVMLDTAGVSSMYANDGGIIIAM